MYVAFEQDVQLHLQGHYGRKSSAVKKIEFDVIDGHPEIKDKAILDSIHRLGRADRDREVYVAMTRAEDELTFLIEEDADFEMDRSHEALEHFIKSTKPISNKNGVKIYEFDSDIILSKYIDEIELS